MAMRFEEITYEKQDGVGLITLNRPHVLNAFSSTMLSEWVQAIEDAKYDAEVKVIVVTGAGRGFCAGADLKESSTDLPMVQRMYEARLGLQRLPRAVES
ncbi:MAG: enoyl-CoA hydratase/isomerase family protein, partial [Chloroflexi bacterium]|nr:enoyl-CoA hydratase/isomerase family protein [Chloroflexota bacterium]